ncbi:MAG: rhodanese-like domain-containing protein [Anaeromyxobacter sp.]
MGGELQLIDLRDPAEFRTGHLRGAINVPIDTIPEAVKKLPEGRLYLLDHAGHQSPVAARVLAKLGRRDIYRLDGGMIAWRTAGLKVVTQD